MANIARRLFGPIKNSYKSIVSNYCSVKTNDNVAKIIKTSAGLIAIGGIVLYAGKKYHSVNVVYAAARPRKRDDDLPKEVKLTMRERRFIKFASVIFNGQLYMTPQDFLDSIIEPEPRPRYKRRILTDKDIEMIKNTTPLLQRGNSHMFRNLKDKGIISYTEYLFLLSILTKPQTGFRIAFNMYDTDGNKIVDKKEFLVIKKLFGSGVNDQLLIEPTERVLQKRVTPSKEMTRAMQKILPENNENYSSKSEITSTSYMEKIFSHAWKGRHGGHTEDTQNKVAPDDSAVVEANAENDEGLQQRHAVDTTIMIHFFGKDGTKGLMYDGFRQFMENLQHEVLEIEFQEFSKGSDTISELDFAKILLRYTDLDTDEYDKYLGRLLEQSERQEDINFPEFRLFYQFLNSLEDFSIAMRMYTLADHPISKDEFRRAVQICTGTTIPMHMIETVFALFDVDGDGQLSYKEFIAIMKDRLHRGFKTQPRNEGWEAFKFCVKQEMKAP